MTPIHFLSTSSVIGISVCLGLLWAALVAAEVSETQQSTIHLPQESEAASSLTTCIMGNGNEVTKPRSPIDFSDIKIEGSFTVLIDIQPERSLSITGDENLLSRYTTTVQEGTLFVSSHGVLCPRIPPKIRMTNHMLASLIAEGSADISISHLENQIFLTQLDGTSNLHLTGKSEKFISRLRGSNTLQAGEFQTQETMVTIDGAGQAWVHAAQKLVAEIKGTGNIRYAGAPHTINQRVYGAGNIQPL